MILVTCCYAVVNFTVFKWTLLTKLTRCNTKLSHMNAGWKNSSLTPNKSGKLRLQVQMCAVFVTLILKFQSVISAERTSIIYFNLKGLELTKFAKQIFWKYILMLNWIHKMENLLFAVILQDKKQTDNQNWNILRFFSNRCYFGLSREAMNATFRHSSCQCFAMLWWTLLFLTPIRCCRCWSN